MPSASNIPQTAIAVENLADLIGIPSCPAILDVRTEEDFAADSRLLPAASRRPYRDVEGWAGSLRGCQAAVICQKGEKLSEGVAAWLRQLGVEALVVSGGFLAWQEAGLPLIPVKVLPKRDQLGRTVWVTRQRPKIDRIACPWLIRRFVDSDAVFLFVAPGEVIAVGERFEATPFDVEGVFWSHRGERCTFDTMVEEFALEIPALAKLATIVRGADTARLDLAPEAAGHLAVSLGLSRLFPDDLAQLEAGMVLYDALYAWCRQAQGERHNWPAASPRSPA